MVASVGLGWTTGGLRNKSSSCISSAWSWSSSMTVVRRLPLESRGMRESSSESELMHMTGDGVVVDIHFCTCVVLSRGWDGGVVILPFPDVADIGEGPLRLITVCGDSTRTRLGVRSVSIKFVGDKHDMVDCVATHSKGRKGEGVTVGSWLVLESVVDSWGLDGSRAQVIEKSLELFAFSVKDPDPVFQSRASFCDAGNCVVPEDMRSK